MFNKNFSLLLSGQLVSQVGDKFHMIALAMWVLKTTGSTTKMGAVLAASLIPSLVLGLFSGVVIDRFNRKYIIVTTDLIRGVILTIFAVLFFLGKMSFPMVLVMQVVLSMNAAFFDPAIPAIIPSIVPEQKLAAANSQHQFVNGFSTIAGAFLGGLFISIFGYLWVFVVNAVSFLISGIFECFIEIPLPNKTDKTGATDKGGMPAQGVVADLKSGYRYMLSDNRLMILLFMVMVIHFFVGSIEVFMPVIAAQISSDGAMNLGFFQGALGSGCIAMALGLSFFDISGREKNSLFGAVFLIGILYAGGSFLNPSHARAVSLYCSLILLFGGLIILASVSFKTLLQKQIDNRFAGRVFAVAGSVGNASIPGAMIIYGLLLEKVSVRPLLMGTGLVLMIVVGISMVFYKEQGNGSTDSIIPKKAT